ncbi:hypothetical protein PSN45_001352 [Yamadazyma tenuis]|uniref:Phosphoglycerate mutase-like protein n=1 Tax=Candida tenuis (strain ATCC 10573 / BCRC 21748 / CBS 615 / JCM 9827 / NBRC 10315 / NRRL Y-1498 / VKM Y-70) TaxID=590646 RepID=G3BCQ4_CANTC|nr:uncharacterized protein CANTEDRAFT_128536 [Yamadazyma tenuis ATCC 10573]EGV60855.1 hypothetical protein CANTEDRAFT_128536 [Yamadazyma tenuis ATCC 10573]WEJ93875.1 hypothetical protein PSN45_001352 [Yamadazyma tenuis]
MGKPTYILLVRHGESEGNCNKEVNRFVANHKVALTTQGHSQAYSAGRVLRDFLSQECFDQPPENDVNRRSVVFYTSPYLRARQTCNNIIEGIKDLPGVTYDVHEEPRMREQDFGNLQSTPEEMDSIWRERAEYGHFFYRIPHGESAADVYDRIASFNESLYRQFQNKDFPNVLILVTHGIWARVFLMKWFRWTYEEFESLRNIPNCQYLIMKRYGSKYCLKTPLETWDDLDDDEINNGNEVAKEVVDEVKYNSKVNVDDLDIQGVIEAQKDAIRLLKAKDRKVREAFNKISSPDPNGLDRGSTKFKYDNQSQVNSKDSFV